MRAPVALYTSKAITANFQNEFSEAVAIDLNTANADECTLLATITNGSVVQTGKANTIKLSYAFSQTDKSATPAVIMASSQTWNLYIPTAVSEVKIVAKDKITIQSRYIHVWIQHDEFAGAVTLGLQLIPYPSTSLAVT